NGYDAVQPWELNQFRGLLARRFDLSLGQWNGPPHPALGSLDGPCHPTTRPTTQSSELGHVFSGLEDPGCYRAPRNFPLRHGYGPRIEAKRSLPAQTLGDRVLTRWSDPRHGRREFQASDPLGRPYAQGIAPH